MESRSDSNVSSTPSTAVMDPSIQQNHFPQPPRVEKNDTGTNPWTPLVLSLDGGGVRGLSSLYILRRIMLRIRELEAEESGEHTPDDNLKLPLPCHYFDNIVGVSTGG